MSASKEFLPESLAYLNIGDTVFFKGFHMYRYIIKEFTETQILLDAYDVKGGSTAMPIHSKWDYGTASHHLLHEMTVPGSNSEYIL